VFKHSARWHLPAPKEEGEHTKLWKNKRLRKYYLKKDKKTLMLLLDWLRPDLRLIAKGRRLDGKDKEGVLLSLFLETLVRGDQPLEEIARRYGYDTEGPVINIFDAVLKFTTK